MNYSFLYNLQLLSTFFNPSINSTSASKSHSISDLDPKWTMAATGALFDVLIIGGGPGGLSTATGLARQLYTAVVFDSGVYRNARSQHMHNVPTWDHRLPAEFRAKARDDLLARYDTIQFADMKIDRVAKMPSGTFQATDAAGQVWEGRKLVLATGVRDVPPDMEGYGDVWGHSMLVHCCFFSHFRSTSERIRADLSTQIPLPLLSRV